MEVEGGERKKSGARRGEVMRRFRVIGNDSAKLRFSRMGIRENLTVTFPLYVTLRRTDGRRRCGDSPFLLMEDESVKLPPSSDHPSPHSTRPSPSIMSRVTRQSQIFTDRLDRTFVRSQPINKQLTPTDDYDEFVAPPALPEPPARLKSRFRGRKRVPMRGGGMRGK